MLPIVSKSLLIEAGELRLLPIGDFPPTELGELIDIDNKLVAEGVALLEPSIVGDIIVLPLTVSDTVLLVDGETLLTPSG